MRNIPQIISYFFIPPINLFWVFIILSMEVYNNDQRIIISILISLIFGLILPVLMFLFLRSKNKIIDNDASLRNERTIPYILGAILFLFAIGISLYYDLNKIIIALWGAYFLTTLSVMTINFVWKISAHTVGIAIPYAVLLFLYGSIAHIFIIVPFFVAWARVYLGLHSLCQVITGFILGFTITYLLLDYTMIIF